MSETTAIAVQQTNVLETIARAVVNPDIDVEKMERLFALQREIMADQRQAEFNAALARVQEQMPQLDQNGRIDYNKPGVKPIPYALLEDIDRVIRPIYSAEGFSVAWDSKPVFDGKMIEIIGEFKHRSGHSEKRSVTMPHDSSGAKSSIQAVVGTISYGKRTLLKMFFNLIEKGTDQNGVDMAKVTQDQADTIRDLIQESGADRARFLNNIMGGVAKIEDIPARDYDKAVNALNEKKRRGGAR